MMEYSDKKRYMDRLAQVVRIITVPPFMVAILLCFLYFQRGDSFAASNDIGMAFAGLVVLPLLSYPAWSVFGNKNSDKRKGQRQLAFIFSIIGYVCCFIYSLRFGTAAIREIFYTYFFTVILLALLNKVFHVRASGHAASSISPVVFSTAYLTPTVTFLFGVLFAASVWASIYLKRHKWQDIMAGICSMIASFILAKLTV
jgi:cation transport ATPase